jgi:hypothetical protein
MPAVSDNVHRQQQLYWNQMVKLKVAAEYVRRYRDSRAKWVTGFGIIKAVASSGSIAAWAIWRDYAFVWGSIIALSQVIDALRDVFPLTKTYKAASEHATALGSMFIDAQLEWENIFSGRYTDDQIANRRHKLMKLQHDAEHHTFPNGLASKPALFKTAEQEASIYFKSMYGVNSLSEEG